MTYAKPIEDGGVNSKRETNLLRVGLITIGQSPRTDITNSFREILEPCDVEIVETGVLDGLTFDQVRAQYWPGHSEEGATIYVSRMRDGTEVKLLKSHVYRGVQQRITELESECDLIVVLCTGTFDGLSSSVPVVFPDEVLHERVRALGIATRLHVVGPTAEQKPFLTTKWAAAVDNLSFTISSPYQEFHLADVVADISASRPEGVVLDCMGYRSEHKARILDSFLQAGLEIDYQVAEEINRGDVPIIVPQETIAKYVRGLLDTDQRLSTEDVEGQ